MAKGRQGKNNPFGEQGAKTAGKPKAGESKTINKNGPASKRDTEKISQRQNERGLLGRLGEMVKCTKYNCKLRRVVDGDTIDRGRFGL